MVEFGQFSRIFYFLRGQKSSTRSTSSSSSVPHSSAILQTCRAAPPGIECLGQTHGTKASSDPLGCLPAVRWCVKRPHVHTCLRCGLAVAGLSPKATAIGAPESGGGNMPRASLRAETSMVPCGRPLRSLPGRILAPDRTDGFGSLNSSTPISAEFRLQTPAAAGPSDRGADGDGGGHAVPRLDVCVSTGG